MSASASSARPGDREEERRARHRIGIERQPLELGLEPFGRAVAARAVARRLLVELGLQHRQVQRGVLRHRPVDDRLDPGRQAVLHAVRHVGAESGRRQDRRAEAPPARSATRPRCVAGSHRGSHASQASTAWLTWVSSERSMLLNGSTGSRAPGCRGMSAVVGAPFHSSNSSSHGQRGRLARVRTSAMPPHDGTSAAAATDDAEPRRRDAPGDRRRPRPVRAGEDGAEPDPRRRRGSVAAVVQAAPQNDGDAGDRATAAHGPRGERRTVATDDRATTPGNLPEAGRLDDVLVEHEAHHAEPEDQQRDERRRRERERQRAGRRRRSAGLPRWRLRTPTADELRAGLEGALVLALGLDVELGDALAARRRPRAEPDRQLAADDERAIASGATAGPRRARRPRSR